MRRILLFIFIVALAGLCRAEVLPRVDLRFEVLTTDTFNAGSFRLVQDSDTLCLPMQVRHRGSSSLQYDKPSYAVKLRDTLGQKAETKLLGMRKSHYWILDAMAIDKARMRNRVGMDLWLEFSRKPWYYQHEPKLINGYNGQMVEVYVNDSAQGIYCLMERIDRKQLKTQKYVDSLGVQGMIYKDAAWTLLSRYWNDNRNPKPTNGAGTWDGWEQKEPDWEDGEPVCWEPLERHINAIRKTTNATRFVDTVRTHLDIPVFVDYVLFTQLLSARDNVNKNLFLSFYHVDSLKALYTPWDLDHSWGRMYNSQPEEAEAEVQWNTNYLYLRMKSYYHLQDTLEARYADLRETYFTIDHIDSLFAKYFDLYARTGMDTIEAQIWSGHNDIEFDIASEQQYIHDWTIERIAYLDSVYHYAPPAPPVPTGTTTTTTTTTTTAKIVKEGKVYINRNGVLYDIYGRKQNNDM